MPLKNQIYQFLDDMGRLCAEVSGAEPLGAQMESMRARLREPLRVAVVGIMKAGKSTFMNALLGANVVYTGTKETTYTVGWFKYGEIPSIKVCFRDGETLDVPFKDMARWSIREYEKKNPRLNDVKYLIVYYPCEVLRQMEFIDTPGLSSIYQKDADNTKAFLGLKSEETLQEASIADAVIYAFSRSCGATDEEVLNAFQGSNSGAAASPINSLGILTKADGTGIWDIFEEPTPIEMGRRVCDTMMRDEKMKRMLFTTFPVCAKPVDGMSQLDESQWELLETLSRLPRERVKNLLWDAERFSTSVREDFLEIAPAALRERLMQNLAQFGILQLSDYLRQGVPRESMLKQLQKDCGLDAVWQMVSNHFGSRSFLIKTRYILNNLLAFAGKLRKAHDDNPSLQNICGQLKDRVDELMSSCQTLNELKVLQSYYNGQVRFEQPEELADFLAVTGEYGRSVEERLGVDGAQTVFELERLAREKIEVWHERSSAFMLPGSYVEAANVITRSYEYLYYHLNALNED